MSQVSYGTITITDTTDIERIYIEYCRSTSNQLDTSVNPPVVPNITVAWSENTPPWVNGQYIWQRSVVKKSGSTNLTYGTPVCLTGAAGATGAAGQSLTATKTEYTIAASNVTINLSNHTSYTWTTNTPDYDSSKPAYWGRITNTYTNPAKTEYLFYKDEALTKAVTDAAVANSIAQHANEDAQGAMSQAAAAQQQVTQIDTLLGGHFLWHGSALSTNTKAGARVVEQVKENGTDISGNPAKWLHNVNIGSSGIQLRYNEAVMAQLAATNPDSSNDIALKFYQPPTISGNTTTQGNLTMALKGNALTFYNPTVANGQSVQATLDANGLKLLKGGIEAGTFNSNDYIYVWSNDDNNHAIKIGNSSNNKNDWRIIAGNKFGVDKAGNLYANNADITGAITATSLTIASGASVSGVVVPSQIANMATTSDVNNASYSVEIKTTAIDYIANTATLVATPYYQGSTILPTGVTLTYQWYVDSVSSDSSNKIDNVITNIININSNITYNNGTAINVPLEHTYICVIS